MFQERYDIVTIGGGIGGSALAKAMAEYGAAVLVLELEAQFRDRVRGESMLSWGVAESQRLGVYDTIMTSGGHELPYWDNYQGPERVEHRHLPTTTTTMTPSISFYHPAIQEAMIQAAAAAGAKVRRGVRVKGLEAGSTPKVIVEVEGHNVGIQARLVVGADGRGSLTRNWGGFQAAHDPERNLIAGVLFDEMPAPEDAISAWFNPQISSLAILFPQGQGRVRAYLAYPADAGHRLSGSEDISQFIESSLKSGAPASYYQQGRVVGPLATFDGRANWVTRPYRPGVALIGDAAATSDPSFGQGLSLTLRDVRVLRDHLQSHEDWTAAGQAYALEHDQYYGVIHTFELWMDQLFFQAGPEGDALRAQAMPRWDQDPTRFPDILHSGPDQELNEAVRQRFFGED
jgi:2-polyprenyl-6-methoxyphenol hydroxylase-like FAD-dependent oxidoreductase